MINVQSLALWGVLEEKATDGQRAQVAELIQSAAELLDRVIETFPTYTRHDSTHPTNVVTIMSSILGVQAGDLSALEATLLLLSAFYHDVGMVFSSGERNRLAEEREWSVFLEESPDAYLAFARAGEPTMALAEWYCRWRHAERVDVYLNRLPHALLKWGQTSFREELGDLCRSHNLDGAALMRLATDFRTDSDLRFCAVLLRLADILDFDRSRSPVAVYEYLDLSRRIDRCTATSDLEWRKHLCSDGFRFPEARTTGYSLPLIAGPDDPGLENDLRAFLDVIDAELVSCKAILRTCSDRWRDFILPGRIDRSSIHSNGYRYGEYRFTLDQRRVVDLMMGENLYATPYVFVRELLQNAVDASRHRRFKQRARGHSGFEPAPIRIRSWTDVDGYQWFRVDDAGTGMSEEIVRDHLLTVGSSYYETAAFRAETLRAEVSHAESFTPVSRFGIGLVSCFLAGDKVEISTLRWGPEGGQQEPIRLSLSGLHGFFSLQTPHLTPLPMPGPDCDEYGYRSEPGTSIAVRIQPDKQNSDFEPRKLVNSYIAWPPVEIEFDGLPVGGDRAWLEKPWCEPTFVGLDDEQMRSLSDYIGRELTEPLGIEVLPLDLTKHSTTRELKGQAVVARFVPSAEFVALDEEVSSYAELRVTLEYQGASGFALGIGLEARKSEGDIPKHLRSFLRSRREEWRTWVAAPFAGVATTIDRLERSLQPWLSHNGIAVPTDNEAGNFDAWRTSSRFRPPRSGDVWGQGAVALVDSLRPNLSVSRDRLLGLPWNVCSACSLALYRALGGVGVDLRAGRWEFFGVGGLTIKGSLLLGDLVQDRNLRPEGSWGEMPIIQTELGLLSIRELQLAVRESPQRIYFSNLRSVDRPLDLCAAVLVQLVVRVKVVFEGYTTRIVASAGVPLPVTEGLKLFPPLAFLPFEGTDCLRFSTVDAVNLAHPIAKWLVETAPLLSREYPGLFRRLQVALGFRGQASRNADQGAQVEYLNSILERLRNADPSVRPPTDLRARNGDFGAQMRWP